MRHFLTTLLIFFGLCALCAQSPTSLVALTQLSSGLPARSSEVRGGVESHQSFRSIGAFIVVEATVDGTVGNFILDTGSPGLVLNRAPEAGGSSVIGLGEGTEAGATEVGEFTWGPLRQQGVSAILLDLRHFEAALGIEIAGLIGFSQVREVPLTIDYPERTLTFLQPDFPEQSLGVPLRFRLNGHLPTMRASVAGRRARLGFDTGSGINVIDKLYRTAALSTHALSLPAMIVKGVDANPECVERVSLANTEIEGTTWVQLPFAFTCLASFRESGLVIDGLLGREWMAQRSITLDYDRRRIYVR